MTEKRKVVIYKYKKVENANYFEKTPDGHGIFLGFGIDFEELNMGVGQYSTAIIELPDGSIRNVPVENIVFNN